MKKIIATFALVLGLTNVAQAVEGNADAGKNKAAMCAACHGADGNSLVPMYPSLAGQNAKYLAKQLADFKKGPDGRQDPVMAGMVMALSEQDMADLGAFFESQAPKAGTGKEDAYGKGIFQEGLASKGITACVACHGSTGEGMPLAGFPSVKSQSTTYLKAQLEKFKTGARNNDPNGMMRAIARKLKQKEIDALAEYMASLK